MGRPGRVRPYAFVMSPSVLIGGMVPLPFLPIVFLASTVKTSFSVLILGLLLFPDHAPGGLGMVRELQRAVP